MIAGAIFFACYGGGHAAAIAPVIACLMAEGRPVVVLGLTTARDYFARRGIKTVGMADLLRLVPEYAGAEAVGVHLASEQSRHAVVSAEDTAAYMGVGYAALEREHGEQEAAVRYARLGRQSFCPTDFFVRLFELHRPAVVVATSSPRSERAVMQAARDCNIPALCLVDLYAPFEIEWCASPDYASRICVLNEAVKNRFVARGVSADRVVVTGNPAFDRLGLVDRQTVRTEARGRLGLAASDRLLLWISQPEPAIHPFSGVPGDPTLPERIERWLAETFGEVSTVHIVMRLHPSEDRPPAVSGARIRYSDVTEPLDGLLCAADCVLTPSSTVGLEAAMLGIPVVQFMDSVFSPDLPLGELGVAIAVPSFYEAASVITRCLDAPASASVGTAGAGTDFNAAASVATQISSLLGTNR